MTTTTDAPRQELVAQIRRLLRAGMADESFAISWFHALIDRYGAEPIGQTLAALTHSETRGSAGQPDEIHRW